MTQAFIAVGSNLGDRKTHLEKACKRFAAMPGIKIVKKSPVYETDPVGGPVQGKYLNAVWEIETALLPEVLLKKILSIESEMGRKRSVLNAPRVIDLDILFYGSRIVRRPGLEIPHPRLHERWFVLKPLADLAPYFFHPVLGKTIKVLLEKHAHHQKP